MSSMEPVDPESLDLVTAALRADADDVGMFTRLVSESLGAALPRGMVEVEYDRGLGDRLAGRSGTPVAVRVSFPEWVLELRAGRHGPDAQVQRVVRGVVISRRQVGVDEWVRLLATELTALATRDAAARNALAALLGTR